MKKKNLLMTVVAFFAITTITLAQVPTYVPTIGLDAYYSFQSNANDVSGNGHNGSLVGPSLVSDINGVPNSAYSFNGISDFIQLSTPFMGGSVATSFSFFTRFKINNSNRYGIWGKTLSWGEVNLLVLSDSSINFSWYNNNGGNSCSDATSNSGIILPNNWYDVVVTFQDSIANIYVNGLLVTTNLSYLANCTSTISTSYLNGECRFAQDINSSKIGLQTISSTPTYFFDGIIDEFGVWNRKLSLCEITEIYLQLNFIITSPINQSVNFSNNAQFTTASSDPLSTYQWQTDLGVGFQNLNNVGQYSGTTNDTLTIANTTFSNNNQPFRCIVSSGSCTDTSAVAVLTVVNNVGINEFTHDNLFSVYPNPAHSQINVKADAKLLGSIYTIYDNIGKVALSGKINSENTVIELGNLSGGIYLFSVGENLKQTFKVIKK